MYERYETFYFNFYACLYNYFYIYFRRYTGMYLCVAGVVYSMQFINIAYFSVPCVYKR